MPRLKHIAFLVKKELNLEWKNRGAINGILLYTFSTIFICYLGLGVKAGRLSPSTWNALFWIVIVFAAINALAKSFGQEGAGRNFYYYWLTGPGEIIISKIIYNIMLMGVLGLVAYSFYSFVLDNPVQDNLLFIIAILLGSSGFATTLTLMSGIASKVPGNNTLMAILSIPIIIPLLLMLIRLSKNAIDGLDWSVSMDEIIILSALNVLSCALSYILFPYLWKS